jgi:hypothetical protein
MALELKTEPELRELIDTDLLKKAMGQETIPEGVLGIYRRDVEDWEGDEVSLLYIVYEDYVNLNKLENLPKLDLMKIGQYFYDTILDRFPRLKGINISELNSLYKVF